MAGEVFTLFARLGIKDDEFNKGIKNASKSGKGLSDGLKKTFKVGAAAIGVATGAVIGLSKAFVSGAKETADYGDKVDKMSQKIGISAEAYQKWDYVMQRAGGNVDSLKMGMKTLSQQAEKNSDAFQKLGISQEEVANLSKEDLFNKTIQGLSQMEDSTERTALATQLLGRAGADMGPLLNQGSEAIQEQMKIAEKYGMVMSDEAVKASAAWKDSLTTLSMTTDGLKNRLMGEFLPSLTQVTDGLSSIFVGDYDKGVEQISAGVENLTSKITEMLPKVLEIGGDIVLNLADSIIKNLPKLLNTGLDIILKIGEGIIEQAPNLLRAALQILISLVQGITSSLPTLIPAVVSVVTEIATILTEPDMLEMLIMSAIELVIALSNGLVKAIPNLIKVVPVIIKNLVTAIIRLAPQLVVAAGRLMLSLIQGLKERVRAVVSVFSDIGVKIKSKIDEIKTKALTWGRDLIQNFIKGIGEKFRALRDKFTSIGELAKKLLGHSTPDEGPMKDDDKWMPDFMDNLANGIERNKFKVQNAINDLAGDMAFDFGGYSDGYESLNDTLKLELSVADGKSSNVGMTLARLLLPYLKIAVKEGGVSLA